MSISRVKTTKFPFINVVFIIIPVMFIITIMINFNLLSKTDECNCLHQPYEKYYFSVPKNKLVSIKHRLAVLVPYRERFEELFNRASLLNAGFKEIKNDFDYIAMHDVDLLPLNSNLSYAYPVMPFHLAAPELHPRYHYTKFIGGILLINREHFELVNGLSNRYWGWGLEDDEFYVRLKDVNLNITRPQNLTTGTNNTFRHVHGKERKRDTAKCYNQREVTRKRDRQTGLHDVKYSVKSVNNMNIDGASFSVINIELFCNRSVTPWCDCTSNKVDKKAGKQ